jgi:hypothetical protein
MRTCKRGRIILDVSEEFVSSLSRIPGLKNEAVIFFKAYEIVDIST